MFSLGTPLDISTLSKRACYDPFFLTESVVALGMKFSTEESLHFVLPSAERVSSMN